MQKCNFVGLHKCIDGSQNGVSAHTHPPLENQLATPTLGTTDLVYYPIFLNRNNNGAQDGQLTNKASAVAQADWQVARSDKMENEGSSSGGKGAVFTGQLYDNSAPEQHTHH